MKKWLLANCLLMSLLFHGGLFASSLGYLFWCNARADRYMDVDLRASSLLSSKANKNSGKPAVPLQPWILAVKGKMAPSPPQPETMTATAKIVAEEESAGPPCPPPCPENAGDGVPASGIGRKPIWVDGHITEDDYPRDMIRKGEQGKVVVRVLIDATGEVRGVEMIQASDPAFNDLVIEKLKRSHFHPARDVSGQAVPCRLILPLVFQLH